MINTKFSIEQRNGEWIVWRDDEHNKQVVGLYPDDKQALLVMSALDGTLPMQIKAGLERMKAAIDVTSRIANELDENEPQGTTEHIEALDEISNGNALDAYNALASYFPEEEVRPYHVD